MYKLRYCSVLDIVAPFDGTSDGSRGSAPPPPPPLLYLNKLHLFLRNLVLINLK